MPARKSEAPAAFLRQEALDRIGGEVDFLEELLELYEKEFRSQTAKLKKALTAGKFEAVREIGHGLKGSSANLSLPGLRDAALAVEMSGKARNAAAVRQALEALEREYWRFKESLA
jgi:HPt (histidine-containing phosphotransfer) domain-containing protein